MANQHPFETRRVKPVPSAALEAAAADALGGPPARPPGLAMRPLPQVDQTARDAFQQRMATEAAAAAPPQPLGSPLFDTPPAVAARAEAVAVLRGRLGTLASQILRDHEELLPLIAGLGKQESDGFDPLAALDFLEALRAEVRGLTGEAEAPAAPENLTDQADPADPTDPPLDIPGSN